MSLTRPPTSRLVSNGRFLSLLAVLAVLVCVSNLQALILPPIPPILPPIDPPIIINFPTVINFDTLSPGTIVTRQYEASGVIFDGTSITAPRIELDDPVVGQSAPNVLSVPHGEIPTHLGPMHLRFTVPVSNVNLRVGRKWSGWEESAVLRAYNQFGGLVGTDDVYFGTSAHNISLYLAVDGAGAEIHRIEVHYVWRTGLDGVPIEVDRSGVEIIDHLTFDTIEDPGPPSDTTPPAVNITVPSEGQVFFGNASIVLQGTITEAFGIGGVDLHHTFDDGSSSGPWDIGFLGTAPNFQFPENSVLRVRLQPGRNVLRVVARDSSALSGSDEVTVFYGAAPSVTIESPLDGFRTSSTLINIRGSVVKEFGSLPRSNVEYQNPITGVWTDVDSVSGSAPNFTFRAAVPLDDVTDPDLNTIRVRARDEGGATGEDSVNVWVERPSQVGISSFVATQAAEGGWLIVGRRTVARVTPWGATNNNVYAELYGYRGGVELPGSPLTNFGDDNDINIDATDNFVDRHSNAAKTWNFLLPNSWTNTAGPIDLVAVVDPDNDLEECQTCQDNNDQSMTVSFQASEELRVRPVAVTFNNAGTMETDSDTEILNALEGIRRIFPYSQFTVLPIARTTVRHNMYVRSGRSNTRRNIADRFTCWDSDRVFGWLEDTFTGCRWDTYTIGFGGSGGVAYLDSPACVSESTPFVAAQELAHGLGRHHAGNSHGEDGGGGHDSRYPHPHGKIGNFGFDVTDWYAVDVEYSYDLTSIPAFLQTSGRMCASDAMPTESCVTHSYLSYGAGPYWTSSYSWNAIWNHGFTGSRGGIGGAAGAKTGSEKINTPVRLLHLRGSLHGEELHLLPFYSFEEFVHPDLGDGRLEARAIDANGKVIAIRFNEPHIDTHHGDEDHGEGAGEDDTQLNFSFSFIMPMPEGTVTAELYFDGSFLGSRPVSANAPTVQILQPSGGESIGVNEDLFVSWTASDLDNNPLTYNIQFSNDKGETWSTIAMDLASSPFSIPATEIPGGKSCQVRVMATDGVLATTVGSGFFEVADKEPFPVIFWPRDGEQLPESDILVFEASVGDLEDDDFNGQQIVWKTENGKIIGFGSSVDVEGLEPGRRVITLEATDSADNTSSTSVEVVVGEDELGGELFLRGDSDSSGSVDFTDALHTLKVILLGQGEHECEDTADSDDDGALTINDAITTLSFLFLGNVDIPAPGSKQCGNDPTEDQLSCTKHGPCAEQ
jgi:hypothetical protein